MKNSSAALAGLGINVEAWLTKMDEKKKSTVSLNDEQEKMKASLKELTGRTQQAGDYFIHH